jgi:tRNA nucleotidyltransferase/poly(A) polymerase
MNTFQVNLARFHERIRQEQAVAFLDGLLHAFPESKVYFVGGMVRDAALGKADRKDFDMVIGGVPAGQLEAFLSPRGKVGYFGKTFGVFKFVPRGIGIKGPIDIALPRKEHSLAPGGYRDFEIQSNPNLPIEEDLSRRDFTINAMAWDLRVSRLIDPFGGLDDLESRQLRAVGDPMSRFDEDYSRVLRALRFACQLGFGIETLTWNAVMECMPHMNDLRVNNSSERLVPFEVIAKELLKAFVCDPPRAFDLYEQSGGFEQLMPEVLEMRGCPQPGQYHAEGDVWRHTRMALESLQSKAFQEQFDSPSLEAELVLTVLLHDIGKPRTIRTPENNGTDRIRFDQHDTLGAGLAKTICTRLKLSSPPGDDPLHVDPDNVWWLVKSHLIGIRSDLDQMKNRTVEKYFLLDQQLGRKLLMLIFSDGMATLSPDGQPTVSNYHRLVQRVEALKKLRAEQTFLRPLLNGHEIMEAFDLQPGPKIGQLLDLLREEQLAGRIESRKDALEFLKGTV